MKKLTNDQKKARLLKHYTFDEILEIIGFYDGSNEDVATIEMELLANRNPNGFEYAILEKAIINGNFEEVIEKNKRFN